MEIRQENARRKLDLPDTRTIVQSLSNVKCRVISFGLFLRALGAERWRSAAPGSQSEA